MKKQEVINQLLDSMRSVVEPSSRIDLMLGSILLAEIRLNDQPPVLKEAICRKLNEALKLIKDIAPVQVVLAVLDDDDDKYVRMIGRGIAGQEIDMDRWPL